MDRFDRYSIYVISWGRGSAPPSPVCPPDPAFADAAIASGIGVYQHARKAPLLSIDGFDRCVATLAEKESDDEPDVGPTDRDRRELEEAQARLRELILADGQTNTGNRWLLDAAADEIVRIRSDRDDDKAALAGAHAELTRLRGVAHMAREALEQARAKAEQLGAHNVAVLQDHSALVRVLGAAFNYEIGSDLESTVALVRRTEREQGAAEMRERAADAVKRRSERSPRDGALADLEREIRGMPLDGAPTAAPGGGLSDEDAETLRAGTWRMLDDGRWVGPIAGAVFDPREAMGLRVLREKAAELRTLKTPAAAHGAPGKATGVEATAAGTSSLAEEQGAAQGADAPCSCTTYAPIIHAGPGDSRKWCWRCGGAPQDPSPKRDDEPVFVPGPVYSHGDPTPRGAYVVGPVTRGEAAPAESEPTARDAVAGMLLRLGYDDSAHGLAGGKREPSAIVAAFNNWPCRTRNRDRAVAALEALARGDMRVFVSRWTDDVDILEAFIARDRATRERLGAREDECTDDAAERVVRQRNQERDDHTSARDAIMEVSLIMEIEAGQRPADVARARMRSLLDARASVKRLACGQAELTRKLDEARAEAAALREEVAVLRERLDINRKDVSTLRQQIAKAASAAATAHMWPAADIAREMVTAPDGADLALTDAADSIDLYAPRGTTQRVVAFLARLIERIRAEGKRGSGHVAPSDGTPKPWRGIAHGAYKAFPREDELYAWTVETESGDMDYVARFSGPHAEDRAREYAALMSAPVAPSGGEPRKDSDGSVSRGAEADVSRPVEPARASAVRLPVLPADQVSAPAQAGVAPAGKGEEARGDEEANHASDERRLPEVRSAERSAVHWMGRRCAAGVRQETRASQQSEARSQDEGRNVNEEAPSMRIEKRSDGEYLVGAPATCDGCDDEHASGETCCHHLNGEHLSVSWNDNNGAEKILARWPIAESAPPRGGEPSRIANPGADDGHGPVREGQPGTETVFDVNRKTRLTFQRGADAHEVMRTVAELLGLPAEEPIAAPDREALAVYVCSRGDCDRNGKRVYLTELQGDGWCEVCGHKLQRVGAARAYATPPDASAAAEAPESPTGGAGPAWRGLEHEVAPCQQHIDEWIVEAVDHPGEGGIFAARFSGPAAEERAREYAAWVSAPQPCSPVLLVGQDRAADNGPWCDRHGGRFVEPQGPTIDALRELAVSFRRNEAMAAARVDKHPDGTRGEPFHDGRRIAFAYCVKALCRVAGIEPPPPSPTDDLTSRARAAGAEEQRVTPEGYTQLPREMLESIGMTCGGYLWFLRSSPGGRWEAWPSDDLDVDLGFKPPPTDGEARELSELRRVYQAAQDGEPTGHDERWLSRRSKLGAELERADLSPLARGYVNGLRDAYTVGHVAPIETGGRVDAEPAPPADDRSPEEQADIDPSDPRWQGGCPRHAGEHRDMCCVCAREHLEREQRRRDPRLVLHRWPIAPASPPADSAPPSPADERWRPGAVWEHLGPPRRILLALDRYAVAHFAAGVHIAAAAMTEANGWRYVGPAKPSQVKPGQVWRCVGIDFELEAKRPDVAGSWALGWPESEAVYALVKESAMLGLKEWTFVRGPR